jgi:hypothetical protein
LLLGIVLLALFEGSWVQLFEPNADLRYMWRPQLALARSPVGLFARSLMLGAIALLWQASIRRSWQLSGQKLLRATWTATAMLAVWHWYAARTLRQRIEDRVFRVFDEAANKSNALPPWVGVYGVEGQRTAIAPSGRFAEIAETCFGTHYLAWGHVVVDGPYVRFVNDETSPADQLEFEQLAQFVPMFTACPTYPDQLGTLWSREALQTSLINPDSRRASLSRSIGECPDEQRLSEVRRTYKDIDSLARRTASVRRIKETRRPLFSRSTVTETTGVIDVGTAEGVAAGMVFCPTTSTNRNWLPVLIVSQARESDSDFVAQEPGVDPLSEGSTVQLCRYPDYPD